jgi:hypothetical protein
MHYHYFESDPRRRRVHLIEHLFFGATLIAAGVALILSRQGIIAGFSPWDLGAAWLALSGLWRIVAYRRFYDAIKGVVRIGVAAWLFICIEHLWGWTFAATWPVALVLFGTNMLARSTYRIGRVPDSGDAQ